MVTFTLKYIAPTKIPVMIAVNACKKKQASSLFKVSPVTVSKTLELSHDCHLRLRLCKEVGGIRLNGGRITLYPKKAQFTELSITGRAAVRVLFLTNRKLQWLYWPA